MEALANMLSEPYSSHPMDSMFMRNAEIGRKDNLSK